MSGNFGPYFLVPRNTLVVDTWSIVHFCSGAALGWIMNPLLALFIMTLYEPFEVMVLSQFLYDNFGIVYGNEALINSLADIVINTLGVAFGYYVLRKKYPPPFTIFEKTDVQV